MAWERSQDSGTGGYAVEIDNAGANTATDGTPQPDRSHGGYVLYITTKGGDAPVLGQACVFTSQADYPGTCNSTPSSGQYIAAISTTDFNDPLSGAPIKAGEFLEIGVDVSALTGQHPTCPAASTVASLYMRSFTGSSSGPTGNLKGYVSPLSVDPASTCVSPTISTTATPGDSTIDGLTVAAPGTAQADQVTVTGDAAHPTPTGTVEFYLCGPDSSAGSGCTSGGAKAGTEALKPGTTSSTATSAAVSPAPTVPGVYCWRAEYTPDVVNSGNPFLPVSHTNADSECFTIAYATPSIATSIGVTTVPAGAVTGSLGLTTLADSATLSGVYPGADLSGQKVTFTLWGPFNSGPTAASCTKTAPVADTATVALTQQDSTTWTAATPTPAFTPSAAGYYTWTASYAGDKINAPASDDCGLARETQQIVGAQVAVEKDATKSVIVAGDPIGFDIKIKNDGAGTATGVTVVDALPTLSGGGKWALDPSAYGCTLDSTTETVTCSVGYLDPTGWVTIAHVHSTTTAADCGTVSNTATLTTTNSGGSGSSTATVTVSCASLAIDKTADDANVSVGSPIGYTVTVTDTSATVSARNVSLSDPLPSGQGISWAIDSVKVGGVSTPSACTITGAAGAQELDCSLPTLAADSSLAVHITSATQWKAGPGASINSCGGYDNTATVTATNMSGTASTKSVQITVACPDLTVSKTPDAKTVDAGKQIGFTITASNAGAGDATGVLVEDPLPTGSGLSWSIAAATGPLTCAITAGDLTCTGTLAAGKAETVHITSTISFGSCGRIDNTATLSAKNDPNAPSAIASTTVACADLAVSKTADAASVSVGSDIGFTVTVTNSGTGGAGGVDLTDPLPTGPGITWSIASASGPLTCKIASGTLTCSGAMAAAGDPSGNDTQSVHILSLTSWTAGPPVVNSCLGGNGTGRYDNTATLTWANGPSGAITSDTASEQVDCPDLSVTKSPDAATVAAGAQIGFVITVANTGSGAATKAVLSDPLPSGTDVNWAIDAKNTTAAGCAISAGGGGSQTLDCALGDLAHGASVKVHVYSNTSGNSCGSYDNTATLHTANAPDVSTSARTIVLCPQLTLVKTADAPTVTVGDAIGFTVTVTNGASATAKDVTVTDALPSGPGIAWSIDLVTLDGTSSSALCSISGSVPNQQLQCGGKGTDLAPGDVLIVHVTSSTSWTAGPPALNSCLGGKAGDGVYVNSASAAASNVPSGALLTDSASEAVLCPQIGITKHADATSVDASSDIGYQVTASNAGPGSADGVVLDDPLPGGSGISWSIADVTVNGATPATNPCAISGAPPNQVLTCGGAKFALAAGDVLAVTVTSHTDASSCSAAAGTTATYTNTAGLTAANTPDTPKASASIDVHCADLTVVKTADASSVGAGTPIGFTITATNNGSGIAHSVDLSDALPSASGIAWKITSADPALSCAITAGTMTCLGELAPGEATASTSAVRRPRRAAAATGTPLCSTGPPQRHRSPRAQPCWSDARSFRRQRP